MHLVSLENSNCDRIFVEKASGVKERPELQAALKYMRAGDFFIVYKFDRIGRSLKDLVNIFADLQKLNERESSLVGKYPHDAVLNDVGHKRVVFDSTFYL